MEILIELASYTEVPDRHVEEKRVLYFDSAGLDAASSVNPLIQIKTAPSKPENTFVFVKYRDHWFYIDDRDYPSKRVFTFLMLIMSLAEASENKGTPVITIPAG